MIIDKVSEQGLSRGTSSVKDQILDLGKGLGLQARTSGSSLTEVNVKKARIKDELVGRQGQINPPGDSRATVAANFVGSVEQLDRTNTYLNMEDKEEDQHLTVVDKIKAQMAYSGKVYGTPLKAEELEAALGNKAVAQTVEMNESLHNLTPESTAYMAQNELPPTVENLYIAQHALGEQLGQEGSPEQTTEARQIEGITNRFQEVISDDIQLSKMVTDKLQSWGYQGNEQQVAQGQWMVEEGIGLTQDKFDYITDLTSVSVPIEEKDLRQSISDAVYEGRSATQALVVPGYSYLEIARNTYSFHVEQTMVQLSNPLSQADQQQAQLQLAQIQLHMSVEANYSLAIRGVAIDVEPLESLIEQLKAEKLEPMTMAIDQFNQQETVVTEQTQSAAYSSYELIQTFGSMPVQLLGATDVMNQSVKRLDAMGQNMLVELQEPVNINNMERYLHTFESIMTTPRGDMGDSIKKAFRNIEDILQDTEVENTPEHQRAVRILGYNQLQITKESILDMATEDLKVRNTLSKLTPPVVLKMIQEGFNPVNVSLAELNQKADEYYREDLTANDEKYSSFLYQLESRHEITEEQRASYIGIYRMLHQVEQTDGAAIGAVYEANNEVTMKNLMLAAKNYHGKKYDQTISDHTGILEAVEGKGETIIKQAQLAYDTQCLKYTYAIATPENLDQVVENGEYEEMSPETFMEQVTQTNNAQLSQILNQMDNSTTTIYQEAMDQMVYNSNQVFHDLFGRKKGIFDREQREDDLDLEAEKQQILQKFADAADTPEGMAKAQQNLADTAEQVMLTVVGRNGMTTSQFNQLRRMQIQFQSMVSRTKDQEYSVPVMVADEMANVHLKIVKGTGKKGRLQIMFETMKFGQVKAEFNRQEGRIVGIEEGETEQGQDWLDKHHEEVVAKMNAVEGQSTNELFTMAKIYLNQIKDQENLEN